jgi:hypothetical protein
MLRLNNLFKGISDTLHRVADALSPYCEPNTQYLPSEPIGEIREMKVRGVKTYFWYFCKDGKKQRQYLSRDKDKAEQRREEMSGWLLDDSQQ